MNTTQDSSTQLTNSTERRKNPARKENPLRPISNTSYAAAKIRLVNSSSPSSPTDALDRRCPLPEFTLDDLLLAFTELEKNPELGLRAARSRSSRIFPEDERCFCCCEVGEDEEEVEEASLNLHRVGIRTVPNAKSGIEFWMDGLLIL